MSGTYRLSNLSSPQQNLFRSVDVWERRGDAVVRFRCFEVLGEGKFWVQSADFYRSETDSKTRAWLEKEFIEVLGESESESIELFDSLEEAINNHKAGFD